MTEAVADRQEGTGPGPVPGLRRRVNLSAIRLAVLLSIVVVFVPDLTPMKIFLASVVVIGLLTSWPDTSRVARACTLVSVGAGVVGVMLVGASVENIASGFTQMASIFAFFVLVRLLELPIVAGGFNRSVARFLSERAGVHNRAAAGGMLTYGLGTGLSVGCVPIAYRSLEAMWHGADADEVPVMGRLVTEGFTAANAWTPISPIVALALESTVATLPQVLVWLLPFSLLMLVFSVVRARRAGEILLEPGAGSRRRGAGEFLLVISFLVVSLVAIDAVWHIGPMGAAMVSIMVVVLIWQASLEGAAAIPRLRGAVKAQEPTWPEHFTLFCSGGLLVGAALTVAGSVGASTAVAGDQLLWLLVVAPVGMVVAAVLGLYPFVSLAAVGALLGGQFLGTDAVALTLALVVGASVGFLVSPFSGLTLLVSAMSGHSSFEVGLRWNRPFGVVFLVSGTALAVAAALTLS